MLKYMTIDEMEERCQDIQRRIDETEARLRKPPAYQHYDRRIDLATTAQLHKYLDEINAEIVRRHTGALIPNCS